MSTPKIVLVSLFACLGIAAPQSLYAGEVLKNVLDRGYVKCAVGNRPVADTRIGETGYEGFFPEFCRVLSLALFNDRNAVELSPVSIRYGLQSIQEGDVDAYISNVTWTFSRDIVRKLTAATVLYYDGQGFMSHKGTVRGRLPDFQKAKVCVSRSTTTIANLEDYIRYHNLKWEILPFASSEGRNAAFFARKCELLTADRLVLASTRATATDDAEKYVLHDEIISKEPLVAYVSTSDMEWANVVRWSVYATIAAEEKGITRANYKNHLSSQDPAIRRLLGVEPLKGIKAVGLKQEWARNIIAGVGNYGEIFDRYLGKNSNIKVKRRLNRLWRDGGLQYSPPFR